MAKKDDKKENKDNDEKNLSPKEILAAQLNSHKEDHYNNDKEVDLEKISSGSLLLDMRLGGGFDAGGLQRFVGFTEGGKTSESLEVAKNFLKNVKKSRALLVKAEGRLSKEMQERSGLKFVWSFDEWEEGTCFVLETNVYELIVGIMRDLVVNNPDKNRYCFILDSMDGLILKSDMDKEITEAARVAGAPALTKKFLQRLAIAMNKFGHLCIMIGQVSAKIEIDPYAPKDTRQISATGGNAAMHFSNWILQFEPRNKGDMIVDDPKAPLDPIKNKIHGHWAKVIIKKSPNESSNMVIQYPIKYGRKDGTSIWVEREIVDLLFMWELLEKKGSWIKIVQGLRDEVKENTKVELPEQIQGIETCYKLLEDNPIITKYLYNKFLKLIQNNK